MIEIYFMNTACIENEKFNTYYNVLRRERQQKIDRCKRVADKKLSLAAGLLLKNALQKHNIHYESAVFSVTDKGKMYLQNEANLLYFNISHSGIYAVVAISDSEVGVDIQEIKTYNDKVVNRCFTEREKTLFYEADEENKREVFATIWAIKESYLKTLGIGITEELNGFETDYLEDEGSRVIAQIKGNTGNEYPKGEVRVFTEITGYIISVCCFEKLENICVMQMDPE